MLITSAANSTVKELCELHHAKGRLAQVRYLIEGVRLIEDALDAGHVLNTVVVCTEILRATTRGRTLDDRLLNSPALYNSRLEVTPSLLRKLADTQSPAGIVGTLPRAPVVDASALPQSSRLVAILDGIADPGNAGTLLRSAAAAGADCFITLQGTVDVYSPKVVRSAMGAHLHIPLAVDVDLTSLPDWFYQNPQILIADAGSRDSVYDVDFTLPTALVIGGESRGAEQMMGYPNGQRVSIPMGEGSESLNAAMAGTIILFEAARQRQVSRAKG